MSLSLELCDPSGLEQLGGGPVAGVVVVDLFRATSTLRSLVEHGHEAEIVATPEEAAEAMRRGRRCLGEWHGAVLAGFVCGNSPTRVRSLPVTGTPLVFLSSNGARSLTLAARVGATVLAGDLANLDAMAGTLLRSGGRWLCVPAGCRGERRTEDDFVCTELARRLPRAAGPRLAELCRSLADTTVDDLAHGPSAQWLTRHEQTGAADLAFILSRRPDSGVLPCYDGKVLRQYQDGTGRG
ncbi:2-phosphosulfolactate phosphatase [Streptomyces albicerus]|uniref:2-phosphosulfolactate phosphatase n=1 Tax=Streptomyces albicerus TaxID=2569859 RepID=UPI001788C1E1|nr:2-phosphosulfolactate phosphatase [Streptomyces albicerus]